MACDPSEAQRALKQKQRVQKNYFDQSCKSLEPLKPGDNIGVRQRGTWKPAVLLGWTDKGEPRSYIVKANDHHYWRNQRDVLKTQEIPLREDLSSEVAYSRDPVADQLSNDPRDESDSELTSATSPIIIRVSSRVIRVPLRYREWFYQQTEDTFLTLIFLCYRTGSQSLLYLLFS